MRPLLILFTLIFFQISGFSQRADSLKELISNSKKIDKYLSKVRKGSILYLKEQVKGKSEYDETKIINEYLKKSKDAQKTYYYLKNFMSEFNKHATNRNIKPDNYFLTLKDIDFLINPDFKDEPLVAFLAILSSIKSQKNNMLNKIK